jgi:hypothetical protein
MVFALRPIFTANDSADFVLGLGHSGRGPVKNGAIASFGR